MMQINKGRVKRRIHRTTTDRLASFWKRPARSVGLVFDEVRSVRLAKSPEGRSDEVREGLLAPPEVKAAAQASGDGKPGGEAQGAPGDGLAEDRRPERGN